MTWLRLHWPLALLLLIALSGLLWPVSGGWPSRVALAWDIGLGLFLGECLLKALRTPSPASIRQRAAALDEAGPAILPLALTAAAASVAIVVSEAVQGGGGPAILALCTVALSWLFVHVIFAFHYAHAFYSRGEDGADCGGLAFPGETEPDYWDFLHFALVIGVASQTADIQITGRRLRRTATLHCLVAFVFNAVVLALAVNTAVGLLG